MGLKLSSTLLSMLSEALHPQEAFVAPEISGIECEGFVCGVPEVESRYFPGFVTGVSTFELAFGGICSLSDLCGEYEHSLQLCQN